MSRFFIEITDRIDFFVKINLSSMTLQNILVKKLLRKSLNRERIGSISFYKLPNDFG